MPEITVEVPEDIALLVEELDPEEIRRIVTPALRERASEELLYDVAEELLRESELTDERASELANDLKRRVAERDRGESIS